MKQIKCVTLIALILTVTLCSDVHAMTDTQKLKCQWIIHGAATATAASAAALSQFPGADNIPLCIAIGGMAISLGKVFDYSFSGTTAREVGTVIVTYYSGTFIARLAIQMGAGWIPFIGNSINAATVGAIIELIGWKLADAYDNGDFTIFGSNGTSSTVKAEKKPKPILEPIFKPRKNS